MAELKPCPFCGSGEVSIVSGAYTENANGDRCCPINVMCIDCGARSLWVFDTMPNATQTITEAWNQRAGE